MRVLLAGTGVQPIPPTGYGGVERFLGEYAEALRRAGHEAIIYNRVRHGRTRDEYPFSGEMLRAARETQYDILHISTPVVANRVAWAGLPYCYTTHSRHWFYREKLTHRWGFWLERRAVRFARALVALTPRLADAMRSSLPADRTPDLEVIPIGIDPERFRPDWGRRNGHRALGVGVIAPFKRWEIAAQAVRGLGWTLRIVGPVVDAAYAARLTSDGSSVQLLGEVSETDLLRLFAESDLLLHPSQVELLAGAVVQGLASGLPVLGCAPVTDLVRPGVTGWVTGEALSEREIVEAWRGWIRQLDLQPDRKRTMGAAARDSAIERFAWPRIVEAHLRLYQRMLDKR